MFEMDGDETFSALFENALSIDALVPQIYIPVALKASC